SAVQDDRFAAVRELNRIWGGACLLKGSGSLICSAANSRQSVFLCSEGNAGMATGGMGDVLSGIVGSLVAQGHSLGDSLCAGVCIHGEAADLSMQAQGQRGMAATDLMPFIRQLVNPSR
ncbi:MAG: bifunctional ADP-dependent NAD(P)H-hydrate dehydratase/NAD(P)H-hydrate epimerase, partial [Gammaproteobacteria bacterium]|nr:bifunctional ADP-dependent NAD(P)H-hydrate dehydratase/NAD(P)H-hydrate epimerase [Gammaproteobacteria bacterium]